MNDIGNAYYAYPVSPTLVPKIHIDPSLDGHSSSFRWVPRENLFYIIWDTGCTVSISLDARNFIGQIEPTSSDIRVNGLGRARVQGRGTVEWVIIDSHGAIFTSCTKAFYVPSAPI